MLVQIFAWLAIITGLISSFAYYFQIHKILKRHSAKDISPITITIWGITNLIWTTYGVLISNIPIIITDGVSFIGAVTVLMLYKKYKK